MTALPTLPAAVAVGDKATSAWANEVAAWLAFQAAPPLFRGVQHTTAQSLTTATWTAINLDLEIVDSDGGHSLTTNISRFTAPFPGWYRCTATVTIGANATGKRGAGVTLNGAAPGYSDIVYIANNGTQPTTAQFTRLIQMNGSTDYVQAVGYQDSGSSITGPLDGSTLECQWVSS